jgi:hypothetical protein
MMKKTLTLILVWLWFVQTYSQTSPSNLVELSGSGVTTYAPAGGFDYTHHSNYTMHLKSITVKWDLRLLMGEPVVDGVFKWTAGEGTPADYLDYKDYVLLECSPRKSKGYLVYIKISPTVPKSGEGYGFNTPGSPSWSKVFCNRKGENMNTKVPGFNAQTAKEIWNGGFYVTGVVLARTGGNDEYLQANKETQGDEVKAQEALKKKSQEKYKALLNPFSLSVKNNDTVYNNKIRPIKSLHPYFNTGFVKLGISNDEFISSTGSVNADIPLSPGWNTFTYFIKGEGVVIYDSLKIFYSAGSALLKDDFNDGIIDKKWIVTAEPNNSVGAWERDGVLFIHQGGEHINVRVNSVKLNVDPNRKLIIEVRSLRRNNMSYYPANIQINQNYNIPCRKYADGPENAKIICDLKNGTAESYVNGELIKKCEHIVFKPEEGIQIGLACDYWQKWEIDEISVYQ